MTKAYKAQFVLSDAAMEVINRSATERKRGDWISQAVIAYDRMTKATPPTEDTGLLERIDGRLANVERQLAVLIQKAGNSAV